MFDNLGGVWSSTRTSQKGVTCQTSPTSAFTSFRQVNKFRDLFSSLFIYHCCVGCDIVQADHAPEAGVAQGIFHGVLVRHHGGIQEEVEEGLEDEVERHEEEKNTQEQVRMPMTMDGNEDTQTRLQPQVTMYA